MILALRKFFKLYYSFFRASFVADLEFRANFISRFVIDIFWYGAQIITFETIYLHTQKIGDWNIDQTRVFLGVLFIADATYMILFYDNVDKLSDRIRRGELDLLLAKPISSQFLISCQRISIALIGNLFIGISWLCWSFSRLPDGNWWRLLWLALLIPAGSLCLYSIRFMIGASAALFTKSDNLHFIWYQIYRLGMRPDSIYVPWVKLIIMTALPVGIIASVPARSVLGPANPQLFIWAIGISAFFLYISHRFWQYCLSRYSSASS